MIAPTIHTRLSGLFIQQPQSFENLTVFPLVGQTLDRPDHIMLQEALERELVTVEEINNDGSVPELEVVNHSDRYVLLVEGEEVSGAKQNRVLNTSILLDKQSRTRIPVSCTEQGRWSYVSDKFSHSGNIMTSKIRQKKTGSVTRSLKMRASYASDQGEVWHSISELHQSAKTQSPTGAMADAFTSREKDLESYLEAIKPVENQVGFLVVIDGKPAGCDLFSRSESFSKVSRHLTKSYAMDAMISREDDREGGTFTVRDAESFLETIGGLKEEAFDSLGVGNDFRYEGPGHNGFALIVEGTPIHSFFFPVDERKSESRPGIQTHRNLIQRLHRTLRGESGEDEGEAAS